MTPTTPSLVAYEASPTVTHVTSGAAQPLNPKEYATRAGALAVIGFLSTDERTVAWGPFTLTEIDQSNPWWKYSCPLRQIRIGCRAQFDAALWYSTLAQKSPALTQSAIDEMESYASGQNVMAEF